MSGGYGVVFWVLAPKCKPLSRNPGLSNGLRLCKRTCTRASPTENRPNAPHRRDAMNRSEECLLNSHLDLDLTCADLVEPTMVVLVLWPFAEYLLGEPRCACMGVWDCGL